MRTGICPNGGGSYRVAMNTFSRDAHIKWDKAAQLFFLPAPRRNERIGGGA